MVRRSGGSRRGFAGRQVGLGHRRRRHLPGFSNFFMRSNHYYNPNGSLELSPTGSNGNGDPFGGGGPGDDVPSFALSASQFAWIRRLQIFPVTIAIAGIVFSLLLTICWQYDSLTLNAGETRHVRPSLFSSAIDLHVRPGGYGRDVVMSVFAFPGNACPPLTGPRASIGGDHDMSLGGRYDYQYDYWHLNKGSKIVASIEQTGGEAGSMTAMLVRGEPSLRLMSGRMDEGGFKRYQRNALSTWRIDADSDKRIEYQVDATDTYILIYGNGKGEFKATYALEATTHDLKDNDPVCGNLRKNGCPPISAKHCIIVSTSLAKSARKKEDASVMLTAAGSRRWFLLSFLSLLPGCLLMIAWEVYCVRRQPQWMKVASDDPEEGLEVVQHDKVDVSPPSSSPAVQPTVAPSTDHQGTNCLLPVAQAQILPQDRRGVGSPSSEASIAISLDHMDPVRK